MRTNKGYHYIRYAVFGIYLLFIAKVFDWLYYESFPMATLSYFGFLITAICITMDVRNQYLWHKEEEFEVGPNLRRTTVTYPLYAFYLACIIWFRNMHPNTKFVTFWYPVPGSQQIALKQQYNKLKRELKKAHAIIEEQTNAFQQRVKKLENERQLLSSKRELLIIEHDKLEEYNKKLEDQYHKIGYLLDNARNILMDSKMNINQPAFQGQADRVRP